MADLSPLPHPGAAGPRVWSPATLLLLAAAWSVVGLFAVFGPAWFAAPLTPLRASVLFGVLFTSILAASFGVVREADHLAHQLGEPYGTLILTLSIVSIEVILIASVLLGPGDTSAIARDSIFAVMMIIINLVMGACLVLGERRHGAQEFNAQGATAYLSMIVLLTTVAMVLPKFTSGAGEFTRPQAIGVAVLTAALYGLFLWRQVGSHKRFFVQPPQGSMVVRVVRSVSRFPAAGRGAMGRGEGAGARVEAGADGGAVVGSGGDTGVSAAERRSVVMRSLLLLALIVPILLLAHHLAIIVEHGIAAAGAPVAVGGVLIAIIVFTPESLTAVRSALDNEMQRAINLCLGAFVSTVGLTVPAVLLIGAVTGRRVVLGISHAEVVLFVATAVLGMLTLNGQRTSSLQGCMHLALFGVFTLLLFSP